MLFQMANTPQEGHRSCQAPRDGPEPHVCSLPHKPLHGGGRLFPELCNHLVPRCPAWLREAAWRTTEGSPTLPIPPLTCSCAPLQATGGAAAGKAGAALVELCSGSSGTEARHTLKTRAKLTSQVSTTTPLLGSHVPPGGQGWKREGNAPQER